MLQRGTGPPQLAQQPCTLSVIRAAAAITCAGWDEVQVVSLAPKLSRLYTVPGCAPCFSPDYAHLAVLNGASIVIINSSKGQAVSSCSLPELQSPTQEVCCAAGRQQLLSWSAGCVAKRLKFEAALQQAHTTVTCAGIMVFK